MDLVTRTIIYLLFGVGFGALLGFTIENLIEGVFYILGALIGADIRCGTSELAEDIYLLGGAVLGAVVGIFGVFTDK